MPGGNGAITLEPVDDVQASDEGHFLAYLSPEGSADLRLLGSKRRYPGGATLFVEGDRAHEALVLLAGEVKVLVASREGREVIFDIFGPGSLLGEMSVIDGRPRSATVVALSPVEVLAVADDAFNEFLDRHPGVLRRLLVEVIDRLRVQGHHQLEFGTGDALGRICARLAELAHRYGEADGQSVVLRSPVTQSELAAWSGLSREAVVKALRALRQLGWVDTRGRTITIARLEQLRQRAAL